ncbi:hypothetical protein JCM16303_000994 [Sporobolomyces ruberrimus]
MLSRFLCLLFLAVILGVNLSSAARSGPQRLEFWSKRALSAGSEDGGISKRFEASPMPDRMIKARQVGVDPKEVVGDSNPVPRPQNINNHGDSDPLRGQASGASLDYSLVLHRRGGLIIRVCAGAMAPFKKRFTVTARSASASHAKRFPQPLPEPKYLNEISHLLATRGKADGTIEYF